MYLRKFWQDHVTQFVNRFIQSQNPGGTITLDPFEGDVLQEGTPQNAANFNNLETGVSAANEQIDFLMLQDLQLGRGVRAAIGESGVIKLNNTQEFPFNNSNTTVALAAQRDFTDYTVTLEVQNAVNGGVGELRVSNKLRNGFQLAFSGAAESATIRYCVTGGMV